MLKGILAMVKSTIMDKYKFNVEELDIMQYSSKCTIPSLFLASKKDNFVNCKHSEKLRNVYSGESKMVYFNSDHHE